jgi:hypothetical protein
MNKTHPRRHTARLAAFQRSNPTQTLPVVLQAVFIVIVFLPTYLQHIYFFSQTHNADEKNKRAAANTQNKNLRQKKRPEAK